MQRFTYTVGLILEGDDYVVHVPALPGAVTQGGTVEEALAMAADLIRVWLHGEPPRPEPDGVRAQVATVTVEVEVVDGVVRAPGVTELARAQRTRLPRKLAAARRRSIGPGARPSVPNPTPADTSPVCHTPPQTPHTKRPRVDSLK